MAGNLQPPPPRPTKEEIIKEVRKRYPHLSEKALDLLAEQQISYLDFPEPGKGGDWDPATGEMRLDPFKDIYGTAVHELGHAYDFRDEWLYPTTFPRMTQVGGEDVEIGASRALRNAYDIAQSAYGADRAMLGSAGMPEMDVPRYLQMTGLEGPISKKGNVSLSQYIQELARTPPPEWGQPVEAFADTLLQTGGDWGAMPPSVLPFLAEMGTGSSAPATAKMRAEAEYERASEDFVKLPPAYTETPATLPRMLPSSIDERQYSLYNFQKPPARRSQYKPPAKTTTRKPKSKRRFRSVSKKPSISQRRYTIRR